MCSPKHLKSKIFDCVTKFCNWCFKRLYIQQNIFSFATFSNTSKKQIFQIKLIKLLNFLRESPCLHVKLSIPFFLHLTIFSNSFTNVVVSSQFLKLYRLKFNFTINQWFEFIFNPSTATKSWSTVSYHQSLAFDQLYLSCNDHCDQWVFQEIFIIIIIIS